MKKGGFTLTELLAVILILGLVLLVVTNTVSNSGNSAKESLRATKIKTLTSKASEYGNADINNYSSCVSELDTTKAETCAFDTVCKENSKCNPLPSDMDIDEETLIDPKTNTRIDGKVLMCYNPYNVEVTAIFKEADEDMFCPNYSKNGRNMIDIGKTRGTYYVNGKAGDAINIYLSGYKFDEGDKLECNVDSNYFNCKIEIDKDNNDNATFTLEPKKTVSSNLLTDNYKEVNVTVTATTKAGSKLSAKYTALLYKTTLKWEDTNNTVKCLPVNSEEELKYITEYVDKVEATNPEKNLSKINTKNNTLSFVTAKPGKATIELKEFNGNTKISKEYKIYKFGLYLNGAEPEILSVTNGKTSSYNVVAEGTEGVEISIEDTNIASFTYQDGILTLTGKSIGKTKITIAASNGCKEITRDLNVTPLEIVPKSTTVYIGGSLNDELQINSNYETECDTNSPFIESCTINGKFIQITPISRVQFENYKKANNIPDNANLSANITITEAGTGNSISTSVTINRTDMKFIDGNGKEISQICQYKNSTKPTEKILTKNNSATIVTIDDANKDQSNDIYRIVKGEKTAYLRLYYNNVLQTNNLIDTIYQYSNSEGWGIAYDTTINNTKTNGTYLVNFGRRYNKEGVPGYPVGYSTGKAPIIYQETVGSAIAKMDYIVYDIKSNMDTLDNLNVGDEVEVVINGYHTGELTVNTNMEKYGIEIFNIKKFTPCNMEQSACINQVTNQISFKVRAIKENYNTFDITVSGSTCAQKSIKVNRIRAAKYETSITVINGKSSASTISCEVKEYKLFTIPSCEADLPTTTPNSSGFKEEAKWYAYSSGRYTSRTGNKVTLFSSGNAPLYAVYEDDTPISCHFENKEVIDGNSAFINFKCHDNTLISYDDVNSIFKFNGVTPQGIAQNGKNTNDLTLTINFNINNLNTSHFDIEADLSKIYTYTQNAPTGLGFKNIYGNGTLNSGMIIVDKYGKGVKTKIGDNAYMFVYPDTNNDRNIYIMGSGDLYDFTEDEYVYPKKYNLSNADTIYIDEGITSIGSYIFKNLGTNKHHVKINLPSTLESISENAFVNSYIDIINTENTLLTEIGDYVFNNAHINELIISDQIESIGSNVFNETDINSLSLPSTITRLDDNAFNLSLIKELTINSNEIEFGNNVFFESNIEILNLNNLTSDINGQILKGMDNLKSITVSSDNPKYEVINNILYTKDLSKVLLIPSDYQNQEIYINENATTLEKFAFRRTTLKDEIEKEYGSEDSTIFNGYILNINNITNLNIWYLDEDDDYMYSNFENVKIEDIVVSYDNPVYELKDMQISYDVNEDEEEETEYEHVLYRKADNSIALVPSYSEEKKDVLVIDDIDYKIDPYALYNNRKYKEVYLNGTISEIGAYALYNSNLDYLNYISLNANYDEDADIIGENALCIKPFDNEKDATIKIDSNSKKDKLMITGEYSFVSFILDE